MFKVKVKKYYNGLLSVRDNHCRDGIKAGGLQIEHQGKIVLEVDVDSLKSALDHGGTKVKSKFPPYKEYRLIDFRYKKEKENKQQSLL
tara:strand:- start:165 stop:428 length:264 start_codon:yes stop_codon:yes gene_type:complete